MRNSDDRNPHEPKSRTRTNIFAVVGAAVILGIASLSAQLISHNSTPIKPASGAAQAMSLAKSDEPTR